MAENKNLNHISKEKFSFVHDGERISDKKFDDKPIGSFKDAWIRFRKNKASVVASIIIISIILFSFLAPVLITNHDAKFLCTNYAKLPGRVAALQPYGFLDGGVEREPSDSAFLKLVAMGAGAESFDGHTVTIAEAMASDYQPILEEGETFTRELPGKKFATYPPSRIDAYLEKGFIYRDIEQSELQNILDWQEKTGLQILYPLVENNEWNPDPNDANYWYKAKARGAMPVNLNAAGKAKEIEYTPDAHFEDNYVRDENGNVVYWKYMGGGTFETAQLRIRVLYYNYYQYLYGSTPDYILGTDSQGYDLALRIAKGIQLSLLISVCVCVINFIIGAIYGAIEGYYGGWVDMIMERISDILSGVPFIIVATLFQMHLASKLGPVPCLLFAYVVTGWIGTAHRVRTQFYRFKHQEYVMAARTLGAKDSRIIWKHIFPNTLGTLITSSALAIPSTILSESMLSFLGIVKLGGADSISLGTLLADAQGIWTLYPHLMLYPAIIISLLMICFNLFSNGLRDAFNPALRGVEE